MLQGNGCRGAPRPSASEALHLQAAMIAGMAPAGLIEVRYRMTGGRPGMGQMWVPCAEPRPFVGTVLGLGERTDVFLGAAPRRERNGGKVAVERAWALWVDCDDEASAERLRAFAPSPTMLLRSGRPGGLHGWWSLSTPLGAPELERALRRVAHHLGADEACAEAARVMRAAGTRNHRRETMVEVERLEVDAHTAAEIVGALPDPPAAPRSRASSSAASAPGDDPLLAIEPSVYIEALTGREVGRDGFARCPFHANGQERTPSLRAFGSAAEGWACFGRGCDGKAGGSIIDLGSHLYGIEPRGRGYWEIRDHLERDLAAGLRRLAA